MTEREQGYIEGLNAAALLCEYHTKGKDSRFAPLIRQLAQKFMLTLDAQSKIAHNGGMMNKIYITNLSYEILNEKLDFKTNSKKQIMDFIMGCKKGGKKPVKK